MENLNETLDQGITHLKKTNLRLKVALGVMVFLCALFFVYALVQKAIADENFVQATINEAKAMEESKRSEKCAEDARKLQQMAQRAAEEARYAAKQAEEAIRKSAKK